MMTRSQIQAAFPYLPDDERGTRVRCDGCSRSADFRPDVTDQAIERHLEAAGWAVFGHDDFCPNCVAGAARSAGIEPRHAQ